MGRIVVVRGMPGAGKTTLARRREREREELASYERWWHPPDAEELAAYDTWSRS